jgi:hypothetical protein
LVRQGKTGSVCVPGQEPVANRKISLNEPGVAGKRGSTGSTNDPVGPNKKGMGEVKTNEK